jgi:hypothetical protein
LVDLQPIYSKAAEAYPGISKGHIAVEIVFHGWLNPSGDKFTRKVKADK